jgi:hypothetical protein
LEELEGVVRSGERVPASELDLAEARRELSARKADAFPTASLAAIASVVGGGEVFRIASGRVRTAFRLQLVVAIVLVAIFVGSLLAATTTAIITQMYVWPLVFGAVAIGDLAGLLITNPLGRVDRTMVVSNMLDILLVRYLEVTRECEKIEDLDGRLKCLKSSWADFRKEIERITALFASNNNESQIGLRR